MAAKRPESPAARQELLTRLAVERRQAPAAEPQQPLRVADLLAPAPSGRADCPHPRQLEDLVAGRLPQKKRPPLVEHLHECPACRRYVVGLREACTGPAPQWTPRPTTGLGMSHVIGLAVAGMLLLLANSAVLDLLDGFEAPTVSVTRPAGRATVQPAPVAPAPVLAPVEAGPVAATDAATDAARATDWPVEEASTPDEANVSERESLAERSNGQGHE